MREIKYSEAILEATDYCLGKDPSVLVVGLGAPDPKGIFGTTTGLEKIFGQSRVIESAHI